MYHMDWEIDGVAFAECVQNSTVMNSADLLTEPEEPTHTQSNPTHAVTYFHKNTRSFSIPQTRKLLDWLAQKILRK